MIEYSDIVVGCSFGDEGKGKVVYNLLKNGDYDLCVRFNGSGNAGHTVYKNGQKFVVHQLPVGVLVDGVSCLISSDCVVNLEKLRDEIEELKSKGVDTSGRLFISKACHIITEKQIEYDVKNNKVGTTGSGVGPTLAEKMLRTGIRVENYTDYLKQIGFTVVDMRSFWFSPDFNFKRVLLEGAQGFELDINWTDHYPYCTSSTCTVGGAVNTGIPLRSVRNIYGISKIYDTYVGAMKFQPDEYNSLLQTICEEGAEYGSTTGRRRQCNFLNLDNLILSLKINSCNICIINKTDILEKVDIFKLYFRGKLETFDNLEQMKEFINERLDFVEIVYSGNPNDI